LNYEKSSFVYSFFRTGNLNYCFALATSIIAQADVTSAFNANKAGDYDKAVTFIEKSLSDPKATGKEKTWRYRGNIYYNILTSPEHAAKYPNAAQLAKESYFKAMELDNSNDYINENKVALASIQGVILDKASKQYETGDFCGAADNFTTSSEILILRPQAKSATNSEFLIRLLFSTTPIATIVAVMQI